MSRNYLELYCENCCYLTIHIETDLCQIEGETYETWECVECGVEHYYNPGEDGDEDKLDNMSALKLMINNRISELTEESLDSDGVLEQITTLKEVLDMIRRINP